MFPISLLNTNSEIWYKTNNGVVLKILKLNMSYCKIIININSNIPIFFLILIMSHKVMFYVFHGKINEKNE